MNKRKSVIVGIVLAITLGTTTNVEAGRLVRLNDTETKPFMTTQEEIEYRQSRRNRQSLSSTTNKDKKENEVGEKNENKNNEIKTMKVTKSRIKVQEEPIIEYIENENRRNPEDIKERKMIHAPIDMTTPGLRISSLFGPRARPTAGASTFHKGIDIAAPIGTFVYATHDGYIERTFTSRSSGNTIEVRNDNGTLSVYRHLSMRSVRNGDRVEAGYIIGTVGNTGISTGPHLHFEYLVNGNAVNPYSLVTLR